MTDHRLVSTGRVRRVLIAAVAVQIALWFQDRSPDTAPIPDNAAVESPEPDTTKPKITTATGAQPVQPRFPPAAAQASVDGSPSSALAPVLEPDVPTPESPPATTVVNIGEPMDADNPPLDATSITGNVISIGLPMDADGPVVTPADTSTEIVTIGEAMSADE